MAVASGQIVSHNLYKDREVADLQSRSAAAVSHNDSSEVTPKPAPSTGGNTLKYATTDQLSELAVELAELRAEFARLRQRVEELETGK